MPSSFGITLQFPDHLPVYTTSTLQCHVTCGKV